MENASKALLIAAAILIAIILIGIGVFVVTSGTDFVKSNINMNKSEITAFNSEFENYEGTSVPGSKVRSLIDSVRTHNNSVLDEPSKQVEIISGTASATNDLSAALSLNYNTLKSGVHAGSTYTVTITYNQHTGLVRQIGYVINP